MFYVNVYVLSELSDVERQSDPSLWVIRNCVGMVLSDES